MTIYLHKILPLLVLPVALVLGTLLVGILTRRRALLWTAFAILWVSSTPLIARAAVGVTERGMVRMPAAAMPAADAIVVLSGGRTTAPGTEAISEWGDPDRFFGGVELFRARKAPLLMFTGGWTPFEPNAPLEGDILKRHAGEMGVPADALLTTPAVVNTAAEATAVAAMLRERHAAPHILLVTSAFHMPRARLLFERAGLRVTPFPVDFRTSASAAVSLLDFVPDGSALAATQAAIRELYGRAFYRILNRS